MKHSLPVVLTAALVLVSLGGCNNKSDEMEAQLLQHDAQIRQMQPVQADAWNQVQSMREELNDLRGQLADLRRIGGSGVLVDKLNRHEQALHQIETSMAMKFDLGDPIGTPPAAEPAGMPGASAAPETGLGAPAAAPQNAPDFGAAPAAAAGTAAAAGAAGAAAASHPASAPPTAATWGQATPKPKQPTAQKDMAVALYDAGVNAFSARKYAEAQQSFSDFVKNYGSDPKAPQAQFYLAECYFQRNQFSDAALAYDTVITKYPSSGKTPGAYLKQGMCFAKMKQNAAAKARLNELIRKFPKSSEAARAKNFLKTNQ